MADENAIFRKTACKVALELGYSRNAIIHCYENEMRAGTLVEKLLNLESSFPDFTRPKETSLLSSEDEIKEISLASSKDEIKEEESIISNDCTDLCQKLNEVDLNKTLRDETKFLWAKYQCHRCGKNESNRLPLPCTHLATCEKCISDKCVICDKKVTKWIEIFM